MAPPTRSNELSVVLAATPLHSETVALARPVAEWWTVTLAIGAVGRVPHLDARLRA